MKKAKVVEPKSTPDPPTTTLDVPTRARARQGGEHGPLTPREEGRAAEVLRLHGEGKRPAEISRLLGLRNMNLAKRYIRAVGRRLAEKNDDALQERLVRDSVLTERVLTRLLVAFEDPATEPADIAKLADSFNKTRDSELRRLDRIGVLPKRIEDVPQGPGSPVAQFGFRNVEQLALRILELTQGRKVLQEADEAEVVGEEE